MKKLQLTSNVAIRMASAVQAAALTAAPLNYYSADQMPNAALDHHKVRKTVPNICFTKTPLRLISVRNYHMPVGHTIAAAAAAAAAIPAVVHAKGHAAHKA